MDMRLALRARKAESTVGVLISADGLRKAGFSDCVIGDTPCPHCERLCPQFAASALLYCPCLGTAKGSTPHRAATHCYER